jgi:Na+/proline symporter
VLLTVGTFIPPMAFVLGPKIWQEGKKAGVVTRAGFFGRLLHSSILRNLVALIALVGLILYMAAQMMGVVTS